MKRNTCFKTNPQSGINYLNPNYDEKQLQSNDSCVYFYGDKNIDRPPYFFLMTKQEQVV